jgi:hypothetical protein
MSWFYNSYSGELTSASGVAALAYEAAIHTGTGWHELPIPASDTEAQAAAYAAANFKGSAAPTTSISKGLTNGITNNPITNAVGKALDYSLQFGNTTGLLTRILKVTFGGILLIAGILKLSGASQKLSQVLPVVGGPAGKVLAA